MHVILFSVAWIALLSVLTSCQGDNVEELKKIAQGAAPAEIVLGSGAISLTLLLSNKTPLAQQSADLRDGATMALEELSADKFSLTVRYHPGEAKLLLGRDSPTILFSDNGTPRKAKEFALRTDAVDSALESVRAIKHVKNAKAVIVASNTNHSQLAARMERGLKDAQFDLAGYVLYSDDHTKLAQQFEAQKEKLLQANAIIIFGDDMLPSKIAFILRSNALMAKDAYFIGNIDWARSNFFSPALEGGMIAFPEQRTLQVLSTRFAKRYARGMTVDAAYGYDAVALGVGIVHAYGIEGLTAGTLTQTSGFRGSLGLFRFHSDGAVQRPMTLYSFTNRKLTMKDPEPDGF